MSDYVTKDSGQRATFQSGMVRDTSTDKDRPDLVLDGPMFLRWVKLMTRGAVKYAARNWMKASGQEELDRFRESAFRHFIQWYLGLNQEEDHAAAVFFNINGAEYVKQKMDDFEHGIEEARRWLHDQQTRQAIIGCTEAEARAQAARDALDEVPF